MADYDKPLPRPADPALTEPFWEATKRHELVIPRCKPCNAFFWYPRQACPNCLSEDWEYEPVSGNGRVHTYTIVRQAQNPIFNEEVPYAYAMIQLDVGVRMISNLIDVEVPEGVEVDMPVEVVFEDVTDEWTLPKFKPAAG
jgi:uncharacterized OB-fold protein